MIDKMHVYSFYDAFTLVSYEDHLWSLIMFRDPKKLYKENIRKEMGWE